MAGFGENCGMHSYLVESFRRVVLTPEASGTVPQNSEGWTVERLPWADPANQTRPRNLSPAIKWRFL